MAMARRSAIPSIHLVGPKYQDFDPKSDWKEEDNAFLIILHLPGFSKERVRITYVHSSQTIRIHGERPIGNSMWSRFDKPFLLPPNCVYDKIYGRFQHGFLTVTIPKQALPTKPQPKPNLPLPENERRTSEDEDQKPQKEASSSSSSSPLKDNLREKHRPEPEVGRAEERSDKAKPEASEKIAEKQMESRGKLDSDAEQNPEKEVKRKESLPKADEPHQLKTEKEENESPEKQMITDRTTEWIPGKTPAERIEKARKGKKEKEEKDTKQKLKILSKRLKEDEDGDNKQMLLINMGAALLVLLAIGAYTAFNFSSFPKSRN